MICVMDITIIQSKIYEIRGMRVMLDYDLAKLYETETKRLKEAVRRNRKRFPDDFMFELTKKEYDFLLRQIASSGDLEIAQSSDKSSLKSQIATSNRGGRRYMPFAFTEHGVAMLAAVLKSNKAIDMNIAIVRAFIALKEIAIVQKDFLRQLDSLRAELHQRIDVHDAQLNQIYDAIENLLDDRVKEETKEEAWKNRNRIGF